MDYNYIVIGKGKDAHILTVLDTEMLGEMDKEMAQLADNELFILEMSMKE